MLVAGSSAFLPCEKAEGDAGLGCQAAPLDQGCNQCPSYPAVPLSVLAGEGQSIMHQLIAYLCCQGNPADATMFLLWAVMLSCRYWVGPCAGMEWLLRYLPLPLQDWLVYRSLGMTQLEPVVRENAAQLRTQQQAAAAAARH